MIKLSHPGHLVTLAMMIAGIVVSRNAQLSSVSAETATKAKDKSNEMRLRRWVIHAGIDADAVYLPFARQILEALSNAPLVLVMDGSQVGRGCMVLMVCVLYKKRALPLAWIVYKGKKGHTTAERHIEALEKVLPLIPSGSEVVLLGDAEYDTSEMMTWVNGKTTWHYVLRTSPQIYAQEGSNSQPIGAYPLEKGQVFQRNQVGFTQDATVTVNLIGWWGQRYDGPLYLVTNLSSGYRACRYYQRRFQIETFFSDQKSRGFNLHKNHLSAPHRVCRLMIASCLAYVWMIYLGTVAQKIGLDKMIHRTDRCDLSLFQLGLRLLEHFLNLGQTIPVAFVLTVG
jgi:hypothetical protein